MADLTLPRLFERQRAVLVLLALFGGSLSYAKLKGLLLLYPLKLAVEPYYDFIATSNGPHSFVLEHDLEEMRLKGLISFRGEGTQISFSLNSELLNTKDIYPKKGTQSFKAFFDDVFLKAFSAETLLEEVALLNPKFAPHVLDLKGNANSHDTIIAHSKGTEIKT